jgi:HIP---CoA ligase
VTRGAVTAAELVEWSRRRMAGYKVPRTVEFLNALPVNATGKVVKDLLR